MSHTPKLLGGKGESGKTTERKRDKGGGRGKSHERSHGDSSFFYFCFSFFSFFLGFYIISPYLFLLYLCLLASCFLNHLSSYCLIYRFLVLSPFMLLDDSFLTFLQFGLPLFCPLLFGLRCREQDSSRKSNSKISCKPSASRSTSARLLLLQSTKEEKEQTSVHLHQ